MPSIKSYEQENPVSIGFPKHDVKVFIERAVELRNKAIDVALSLTSGAYQTSLVTYFTHRDLFPALMKVIATFSFSSFSLTKSARTTLKP